MTPTPGRARISTDLSSDDESRSQDIRERRSLSLNRTSNQQRKRARLDDSSATPTQANQASTQAINAGSSPLSLDPNIEAMVSGLARLQQAHAGDLLLQLLAARGLQQMTSVQQQVSLPSSIMPSLTIQQPQNIESVGARGLRVEDILQQLISASTLAQLVQPTSQNLPFVAGSVLSQQLDPSSLRANATSQPQNLLCERLHAAARPYTASASVDPSNRQGYQGLQSSATPGVASLPPNFLLPQNQQQTSSLYPLLAMLGSDINLQQQNRFQSSLGLEMLAQSHSGNHMQASSAGVQQHALSRQQITANTIDSEAFKNRDARGIPYDLPARLALSDDHLKLSIHQTFLRLQIEAFRATDEDVSTHTRGRNKPIVLGQVGIRCRHCAHIPVRNKQKGSAYFPAAMTGIYQAAQNMCTTHLQCGLCSEMPDEIKQNFADLLSTKSVSSGAGRPYWAQAAKKLGLVDTENGIRFIRDLA